MRKKLYMKKIFEVDSILNHPLKHSMYPLIIDRSIILEIFVIQYRSTGSS